MRKTTSGFTIVELLIVIVVIAILAAVTIVAYNGIQHRAKAAAISSGINATSKSMRVWLLSNGQSRWPNDLNLCGHVDENGNPANNPSFAYLIDNCDNLKETLQRNPSNNTPGYWWRYDSDGDVKPSPTTPEQNDMGVNIVIEDVPANVSSIVDKSMDDGDPNNGRVRIGQTGHIFYSMSFSPNEV